MSEPDWNAQCCTVCGAFDCSAGHHSCFAPAGAAPTPASDLVETVARALATALNFPEHQELPSSAIAAAQAALTAARPIIAAEAAAAEREVCARVAEQRRHMDPNGTAAAIRGREANNG